METEPAITPAASPEADGPTLRAVPWRWSDLGVGLAPLVALQAIPRVIGPATLSAAPRWAWVPLSSAALAWMLAFPLAVARRRSGWRPARPKFRAIAIEVLLALAAVPVVVAVQSGLWMALVRVLGESSASEPTLEPIAGAADPFHPIALVILAVGLAPFAEEVFFRGMLANALRTRLGPIPAALLQAVAFGLIHPFGAAARARIGTFGLILGGLALWRRSLIAPIALHASINVLALATMFAAIAAAANAPVLGVRGADDPAGCRVVLAVPGSPAERAGLRAGDIITRVAESPVKDFPDLVRVLRLKQVGDSVPIVYLRDGETLRADATLGRRPE